MRATAAMSVAALVAALAATPSMALDACLNANLAVEGGPDALLHTSDIDVSSVPAIDANADGSVEVCEG